MSATAASISAVVEPGTASWRTRSSASATTRPASRIRAISRGLFNLITDRVSSLRLSFMATAPRRRGRGSRRPISRSSTLAHQAAVIPHDQVAVDLLYQVEADADDDQKA